MDYLDNQILLCTKKKRQTIERHITIKMHLTKLNESIRKGYLLLIPTKYSGNGKTKETTEGSVVARV